MTINIYIFFFSRPRRAVLFFPPGEILCGLYEEMECSNENRALGNYFFSSELSQKIILTSIFTRGL
jgi:hypothetical protein